MCTFDGEELDEGDEVVVKIDDLDLNNCSYCEIRLIYTDAGWYAFHRTSREQELPFTIKKDGYYELVIFDMGRDEDDYIECSGSVEW